MYPVLFIDAIMVKVRDGQVTNRPVYVAVGVTCNGERDILGLWAGDGGEGAKFWLGVLTEIKNRGVDDVCIVVCDGLKGLPDSVTAAWPLRRGADLRDPSDAQHASGSLPRQHWDELAKDLRPIYTAPTPRRRRWPGSTSWPRNGAAGIRRSIKLWRSAWTEFIPFLDYDVEIRRIICTTNAIEILNARYRRAIRARGHFPTEQAALKCLYLVTRSLDPTGRGRARWVMRWKPALNAFAITFEGRIVPTTTN